MKILFIGGDKRYLEIINSLLVQNHEIDVVGYDNAKLKPDIKKKELEQIEISDYKVIIFPVSGVEKDFSIKADYSNKKIIVPANLLIKTDKGVLIFTGIITEKLQKMLDIATKDAIALMDDKDIAVENSIPTIEGIIGDLIYNTDTTINESNILVLGYGNIGKRLVEMLSYLGANVTVGVNLKTDYELLNRKGIKAIITYEKVMMDQALENSNIIVNTVPSVILRKRDLEIIDKDCYVLDIASYPHGIEFSYIEELKLKCKLLLGIPSIVAPKTAGLILSKKINSVLGGKE